MRPLDARPEAIGTADGHTEWAVGPLVLRLPTTWSDTSTSVTARLGGPASAFAVFVVAASTPAAREAGYSIVADPRRGPDSFLRVVDWEACIGSPTKEAKSLPEIDGRRIVYAECRVEARRGQVATFVQLGIYSADHWLLVHAMGNQREIAEVLQAVAAHRWRGGN